MKKILVIVDYQNDFVVGNLGFSRAKALDDNICRKITEYSEKDYEIVYTLDIHETNYLETREGIHFPKKHCIKETTGTLLYGNTAKLLKNKKVFKKQTFGSSELFEYLKNGDYTHVELAGLITGICVFANAVLALTALPDAKIIVDLSCTADDNSGVKTSVIETMKLFHITTL